MDSVVDIRANDLKGYPADVVDFAISEHRKKSSFWPALADIQPFIDALMTRRERERERLKHADRAWVPDEEEKFIEDPKEVRTAAAEKWRNETKEAILAAGVQADKERMGMHAPERVVKSDEEKPWNDPEVLRASSARIRAWMEAEGKPLEDNGELDAALDEVDEMADARKSA